jgi:hypothetical protein
MVARGHTPPTRQSGDDQAARPQRAREGDVSRVASRGDGLVNTLLALLGSDDGKDAVTNGRCPVRAGQ